MDNNEDQHLHLPGEDSSKVSSVLRPFTPPKFDFDDSLHGQLRFDSLVENEDFLGITGQVDNYWIEDFSSAGNRIVFSSSAEKSCSLPSHINVWSEAASSESVEMLLNAVVQEEKGPSVTLMQESNPVNEQGPSAKETDSPLMKGGINSDSNNGDFELAPMEVEGSFSMTTQDTGVGVILPKDTVGARELEFSSREAPGGDKDNDVALVTEGSSTEMMRPDNDHQETHAMENESLSCQVNENSPAQGEVIDDREILLHKIVTAVKSAEGASNGSGLQKTTSDPGDECSDVFNKYDDTVMGVSIESDNIEKDCSLRISSKVNSSEEKLEFEMPVSISACATAKDDKGVSISANQISGDVTSNTKYAGDASSGTKLFSSTAEVKLSSDGPIILYEHSSRTVAGEGREGSEITSYSGSIAVCSDIKLMQAPIIQSLNEDKSFFADEDVLRVSDSSLEAQNSSFEPSGLCEVNPIKVDPHKDISKADYHNELKNSTIPAESCGKIKNMEFVELRNTTVMEESTVGHIDDDFLLVDGSRQASTECISSRLLDKPGSNIPVFDGVERNLVHESSDVVKEAKCFSPANKQKDETIMASHSDTSQYFPVPNSKDDDKMLTSSAEAVELADISDNLLLSEAENRRLSEETLLSTAKKPSTLASLECLKSDVLASSVGPKKATTLNALAGEIIQSDRVTYVSETSNCSTPYEPSNELEKKMEQSDDGSLVLHEFVGADDIDNTLEEETGRSDKEKITAFSAGQSRIEQDKLIETAAHDQGCDGFNVVNIDEVLVTSETSEPGIPVQEGRGSMLLGPHSTSGSGNDICFPRIQACSMSEKIGEQASSSPTVCPGPSSQDFKSPGRKTKRGSSKSVKGIARRANQVKEAIPVRQNEKDKSSQLACPLVSCEVMNFGSCIKPGGAFPISASGLPDLNTSALPYASYQQPFTDLQQLQLRAQIIVYGSLIQGAAPDEACMVSAFDGNRNLWESSWHACVDRLQDGKSRNIIESFVPTHSAESKVPDLAQRQGFSESGVLSSVAARTRNNGVVSPVFNPMIPPSSPLWTMSTVSVESHPPISTSRNAVHNYQIVSPLNQLKTPPMRNHATHSSWPSQVPLPVPWLAPSQSSPLDLSTNFSAFPIYTPVKLNPISESSLPVGLGPKHFPPVHKTQGGVPTEVFTGSFHDSKSMKVSSEQSTDKTNRKRKKGSNPEDVAGVSVPASFLDINPSPEVGNQLSKNAPGVEDSGGISFIPRVQIEAVRSPAIASHYSTSVSVTTSSMYMPESMTKQVFPPCAPSVSGDSQKRFDLAIDSVAPSHGNFSKVEEAKLQAEGAGVSAASSVAYCESVWSQLGQLSTSHLNSDLDSRLASSAVAIAAAASVAKAAAASAKVAENVALQAKQMFEDAVVMSQTAKTAEYSTSSVSNSITTLNNVSSASILSGLNIIPSSAIAAAKEASRKKIEDASTATVHAANLGAIVKAAELTAEAVSHVGKIVAMVDPFSLSKLVEAGLNNYWKDKRLHPLPGAEPNEKSSAISPHEDTGVIPDFHRNQQGGAVSDAVGVSSIKEGSRVEVLRYCGDSKKAWFSATVMGLREGEALVCYSDIHSGEGPEQLKEWVSTEIKDNIAPRLRSPHPLTFIHDEGSRKRSRVVVMDYNWSLGDMVNVWDHNCWYEAIVSDKNQKDGSISVKFLDEEESRLVKVWHLRPTLIWNGIQWVEWTRSGHSNPYKGDTPAQKRPKIVGTVSEITEKGKQIPNANSDEIPRTEGPTLNISAIETKFSIGTSEVDKSRAFRATRLGFSKEGSRAGFGVPKPGKKRKFMEVSKHYVSEHSEKSKMHTDAVKSTKFLPLTRSTFRNSESSLKVEVKEKRVSERKPRPVKPVKPTSNPSRASSWRDDSTSSQPDECDDSLSDHAGRGSASPNESQAGEQNIAELGSTSNQEGNSGDAIVFSSQAPPRPDFKKVPRNTAPKHFAHRRIPIPVPSERLEKNESLESFNSEAMEPRRSVRRIQPTSRLLEGLQSSLIISKLPSHDKSQRSHHSKGTAAKGGSISRG